MAVPTKNLVRGGVDAARSRDGISPPATACDEAVRASQAQVTHCRSADRRLAVPGVFVSLLSELRSSSSPRRSYTGIGVASAWDWRWKSGSPRRPAGDPGRDPQSGPGRQPRKPALGCATHSWRVAETRYRHRPINRRQVHASASPPALSGLAGLPAQSHCHIAAIDLFVVPTIGFKVLYGLVILRLERRRLVWANVTANPTAEWIAQQIVEAFPWNEAPRYLIRDRDTSHGAAVTRRLRTMGIRDRPTAPRSPWQNGHVERLIGSIQRPGASTMSWCSAKSLRRPSGIQRLL